MNTEDSRARLAALRAEQRGKPVAADDRLIGMDDGPTIEMLAEQSVLGCLLQDAEALPDVAALISPQSFGHRPHGHIFAALSDLAARHEAAGVLEVADELSRGNWLDACGGLQYLTALADSVPSAAGVARYARKVRDVHQRRRLLDLMVEFPARLREAPSPAEAVEALQAELTQFQAGNVKGEPRRLGEFVSTQLLNLNAIASGETEPGMPFGIAMLDRVTGGAHPGDLVVLAARTSVGKTSLATQIAISFGEAGRGVLILSQEMTGGQLATRTLALQAGIDLGRLGRGEVDGQEWAGLTSAADELSALPVWVDDRPALRLVDIAAKIRQVQRHQPLSLVVVDYLQLCDAQPAKGQSRHHQIEAISRGLKALAKDAGLCILLLSQLNRGAEEGEPELWHLKESGAIEEDADVVLLLHPVCADPQGARVVCVKVAKNRSGKCGRFALSFQGATQRWLPSDVDVSPRRGGDA